jgi:hypothetical protein
MADETDRKRRALYLAKAITRRDEAATECLEREFPGERKRIEGYRLAYYNPLHQEHAQVVAEVAAYYATAGDWLE